MRAAGSAGRYAALALALALAATGVWSAVAGARSATLPRVAPDTPATAMDLNNGPASNSPKIVADPTDSHVLVLANRIDSPAFGCALQISGNTGRDWAPIDPVPHLPEGADRCYAPEVAFDRAGVLYYLFVGLAGAGNQPMGVYLTRSTDRGNTFEPPHQVLGAANFSVRLAIDPTVGRLGRIHVAWLAAAESPPLGGFPSTDNPVMAEYSDDGGKTFSTPVRVSPPERRRVVGPALAVGPGQRVFVSYYDLGDDWRDYQGLEGPAWDGAWSIVLATSTDGGRSFAHEQVVDDGVMQAERVMLIFTIPPPSMAVRGHLLCMAWSDSRNVDRDVFSRCSATAGRTWGPLVRANDDAMSNGHRQELPTVAVAPGGRVDLVYLDRNDPLGRTDVARYTYSLDGGRSFRPSVAASASLFNARIGARYGVVSAAGQVEFGSRLGLLSLRDTVVAAWPDTRNSSIESGDQDVFTARIAGPSPSGGGSGPGIALVAISAAILAATVTAARRRFG